MSGQAVGLRGRDVLLSGWGRTSHSRARAIQVVSEDQIAAAFAAPGARGLLARGLGRSYGDVAQSAGGLVLDMTSLSGVERLDESGGTLTALSGTSFDTLLRAIVPAGWFLPVTPGTRFVTLGGAIANDVHGKNHHLNGSLADHLISMDLMTPDGQIHTIEPGSADFGATCGGLGLTGVIVRATIRLLPIASSYVKVTTQRLGDLDELMAEMRAGDENYRYSVAWVDPGSPHAGRGVLTQGDHASREEAASLDPGMDVLAFAPRRPLAVPASGINLITPLTAKVFSEAWFRKAPRKPTRELLGLTQFFHPLDGLGDWSRLYGRAGFVQYQFVVPDSGESVIRDALRLVAGSRPASCLTVLKRMGPGRGMLSFPSQGWTLAIDFPAASPGLAKVLSTLDRRVCEAGGRVYLAKDSTLDPDLLPHMYPEIDRWREIRDRLDPGRVLRSDMDRRLRLVTGIRKSGNVAEGLEGAA